MNGVRFVLMVTLIVTVLFAVIGSNRAAELHTEHTFRLTEGESPPPATIDDAAWLAGDWVGTAFGKRFEEVWNPPSAGSMIGLFKLFDDDGAELYELLLLTVENGTLSLKVKHFNPDFSAWEEKDEFVEFRLVALEENALHFSGISFYRRDPNRIDGYILSRHGDSVTEQHLEYQRREGTLRSHDDSGW